jgi:FKBP-type peptidyl-prolyl cis-trans isomerase
MLKSSGGRPPYPRMYTKNTRRLAAALAVPVLLFTAACGSDDSGGSSDAKVKVTGKFGEKPKIDASKDAKFPDDLAVKTVHGGKGAKVKKGDYVRLDVVAQSAKDGKELISTWAPGGQETKGAARQQMVVQPGKPGQGVPPDKIVDALVGKKVGSRILAEGTANSLLGAQVTQQAGLQPEDGLAWVVDVVAAKSVNSKSEVKGDQAAPKSGLPEVKAESQKAATITVPKGEKPPKKLQQQVLIKGKGPKVKAGEGLIAQYTGVKWEDGKKFDSSWDHSGAIAFQIGTGSVVKGWDQALVGKHVGDRVLIVIPPELGYGASPQHQLAKNTLVFAVDIIGTV